MKKLLQYQDGVITWNLGEEENIVYLLLIGNDKYIGTTSQPRNRLNAHLGSMLKGKHQNHLIQDKFNEVGSFVIYLLEECFDVVNRYEREKYHIYKLQPTLNVEQYYKEWSLSNMTQQEMLNTIRKIIHSVRIREKHTFKSIEHLTGIGCRSISKFEKGLINLSMDDIISLFHFFHLTVNVENDKFFIRHNNVQFK